MPNSINASRFADLQGLNDFDRAIIEKKYAGKQATYQKWHTDLTEEGFEIGVVKSIFVGNTDELIEEKESDK